MNSIKVAVTFANDQKIILNEDSQLFSFNSTEENHTFIVKNILNGQNSFIKELIHFFSKHDYFTVDESDILDATVFNTKAIVSFKQYDSSVTKASLFKKAF